MAVQGLDPNDVTQVDVVVGPTAVGNPNFGLPLFVGNSPVIDTNERIRFYSGLPGVVADFGVNAPETIAAGRFFGQPPTPARLAIGRWAMTASSGLLHGGILSIPTQVANLTALQAITVGALSITVDGVNKALTTLNFSSAVTMSNVAAILQAALTSAVATVSWSGSRFTVTSKTTGIASTVTYASPSGGNDVATLMGLNVASGASLPIAGIAAETPVQAVALLSAVQPWYAVVLLASLSGADTLNVAAFIEGASPKKMFAFSTGDAAHLDPTNTSSIGYQLFATQFSQTTWIYSSTDPYAVCGMLARGLNVNFQGSKTANTLKFKQIIGTVPEVLTETQKDALEAIGGNVSLYYSNGASFVEQGTMADGRFFDEVYNLNWLQNYIQLGQFNLFYQTTTKIPQTDAGMTTMMAQLETDLEQGITNGIGAPGQWNAAGFGQLVQGQTLAKGYYTYAPPVSSQEQSDREARHAVLMQVAFKMAGAVHDNHIILNINR